MNTTVENKANELSAELTKRGISGKFSVSNTDYGTSCYFTFYKDINSINKLKIRISDHSATNMSRIENEVMYTTENIDIERAATSIEVYLFPERFEFVASKKGEKITHRINGVMGRYERKF